MNERNVEALAAIIWDPEWDDIGPDEARHLAERLASRGVLIPSALTDEQTSAVWWKANLEDCRDGEEPTMLAAMRAELERIAKGEPA